MFSITPSTIIEYLYCPRFTFFEYVLGIPQNEDKYYKVERGRAIHQQKTQQNVDYLRQRIGVKEKHLNQYLTNDLLRGEMDEILLLKDDTMAPLDYKFAQYKERKFDTYKTQLYAYAWLIQDNFQRPVNKGYLVYTRSQNKLIEVPITEKHIQKVKKDADEIKYIIQQNFFPKATKHKKKCVTCTYRNVCIK